jgi:hypothetical protein
MFGAPARHVFKETHENRGLENGFWNRVGTHYKYKKHFETHGMNFLTPSARIKKHSNNTQQMRYKLITSDPWHTQHYTCGHSLKNLSVTGLTMKMEK